MLDCKQYQDLILAPCLNALQMYSNEAVMLMLGTMATESLGGTYIAQVGGPALGIYQMEPATHDDIWNRFLSMQPIISHRLMQLCRYASKPTSYNLMVDIMYATAMARIHYYRVKEAIPTALDAIAQYYKTYYNGPGTATPSKFISAYNAWVNPNSK